MGDQDLGVTLAILLSGLIEAEAAMLAPAQRADGKTAAAAPPALMPSPRRVQDVGLPRRASRALATG